MFEKAKWIWISGEADADEYGEFFDSFDYKSGKAVIAISCDSNYALYVNGDLAGFGQYADFPWYKVYDETDITAFLIAGRNELRIIVWHYGADFTSVYYNAEPCLIYEAQVDGKAVAVSSDKTLCRKAAGYASGLKKVITGQMGYSFRYDTRLDGAASHTAYVKETINYKLHPRPIKKLSLEPLIAGKLIDADKKIYDLGRESAGLLYIRFKARSGALVRISYGEHLADGIVRRIIAHRDFSVEAMGNDGTAEYLNPFRRLGCRYLQIESDTPVSIEKIGIMETPYPVTKRPFKADSELRQRIYDTAVRTLRLCMHEHYEDTPWREQALYALDSRNQMLCGYYAFKGGNFEYARANLKLMGEDRRDDGLLSICSPSGINLTIPSFSLYYIIAMQEYAEHSGDTSLLREYRYKLEEIIEAFCKREENGLISTFSGSKHHWNFYEWADGLTGVIGEESEKEFDLALNSIFLYALQSYIIILKEHIKMPVRKKYNTLVKRLKARINEEFYNAEKGLYRTRKGTEHYSEFVNAMAVLSGAADKEKAGIVCGRLASANDMIKATLSMTGFKYDALLLNAVYQNDNNKYASYILNDIDTRYETMLEAGATSFWETEDGEKAFGNAGSLCHGWSAMPVYYYKLLCKGEKNE